MLTPSDGGSDIVLDLVVVVVQEEVGPLFQTEDMGDRELLYTTSERLCNDHEDYPCLWCWDSWTQLWRQEICGVKCQVGLEKWVRVGLSMSDKQTLPTFCSPWRPQIFQGIENTSSMTYFIPRSFHGHHEPFRWFASAGLLYHSLRGPRTYLTAVITQILCPIPLYTLLLKILPSASSITGSRICPLLIYASGISRKLGTHNPNQKSINGALPKTVVAKYPNDGRSTSKQVQCGSIKHQYQRCLSYLSKTSPLHSSNLIHRLDRWNRLWTQW